MNLKKHLEFFSPNDVRGAIHIIGIGAIGSCIAELLARLGIPEIHIYDFDTVDEYNITNQIYTSSHIKEPKVSALTQALQEINPNMEIKIHAEGWKPNTRLSGTVFLCVDDIDLRRTICEENKFNQTITCMSDTRMRLTDAQGYFANWNDPKEKTNLLKSMAFSHEEAKEATPLSACGTTLSITPTVRVITALQVANWINFVKGKDYSKLILADAFDLTITKF